jgi:hypothetical protein
MSTPFFELDSSIPDYTGRDPLKLTTLKTHQKKALHYMRLLESENPVPIIDTNSEQNELYLHTNYGFYADPACTGKSYVILSLLSLNKCVERKKLLTIWSNGLGMNVYSKIKNFEIPLSIIVSPLSSIGQWSELISKETDLKFYVVDEYTKIEKISTYDYDVLLVADCIFESVCIHFQGFSVSRLIFDDLYHLEIQEFNKKDRVKFGDLRSSFTWFVSSHPQECIQKFRYSNLPFSFLIQQIFSFPHPGLLFRNKSDMLSKVVGEMLPEIKLQSTKTFFPSRKLTNSISNENPEEIVSYFVNSLEIPIKEQDEIIAQVNPEMKTTFEERFTQMTDPVTYEKIQYPTCMECCYQIFDLHSLCKCIYVDYRCPYCRKNFDFQKLSFLNQSIYMPLKKDNIWVKLEDVNLDKFNIIYIPTLKMKSYRSSMVGFYKELNRRYKCMLYFGSKAFNEFKHQKGILVISKPLHSNLHLRFVDKIYVIHPMDYIIYNKIEWFSDKICSKYGQNFREFLTDFEMGSFCIGSQNPIDFDFIRFQ